MTADRKERGDGPGYADEVGAKERRKIRARTEKNRVLWFGLGLFGTVGWSVAIPALAFLAAGVWLDEHHPVSFSWTLTLLVVGVALGCFNAWLWIQRKMKEM